METTAATVSIWWNGTKSPPREHPASYEAQVIVSVFIAILGLWSTLGNTLTILAISTNRGMRTKSNFFICSLAISDLLSGMIASPLWLYRRTWGYEDWLWGDFLCKLFWFVDESTSYCTAWHIAAFAVWRYMGVGWPHSHAKIAKRKVRYLLIGIWVMALVFGGAIFCTFYQVEPEGTREEEFSKWPSCSIKTTENGVEKHLIYYTFSSISFMLLPMSVLSVSSILITKELLGSSVIKSESRILKERRAVAQLGLVSASFLLGYMPNICYVMWTTRSDNTDYKLDYWVQMATYFCLRASECLNPIIYNVTSSRMRKASKKVLHHMRNCGRSDAELELSTQMSGTSPASRDGNLHQLSDSKGTTDGTPELGPQK